MAITDASGIVKATYNYSPYGELIDGEYDENIQFLYNGQFGVTTDSNGLYYMRARYYNVDIKRFINQDVLTGTLERISSLNRYAYVEGNPVSYLDPFGLAIAMLQTVIDLASVVVGMLSLLTFIAPQAAIMTNLILWAVSIALDLIQLIRYDGAEDKWKEFENDFYEGILTVPAPLFAECGSGILKVLGNIFDNAIATIVNVFRFVLKNDGYDVI